MIEEIYIGQIVYLPDSNMLFKVDAIHYETLMSYCYIDFSEEDYSSQYRYRHTIKDEYKVESTDPLDSQCFVSTAKNYGKDLTEKYSHLFGNDSYILKTDKQRIEYLNKLLEKCLDPQKEK